MNFEEYVRCDAVGLAEAIRSTCSFYGRISVTINGRIEVITEALRSPLARLRRPGVGCRYHE